MLFDDIPEKIYKIYHSCTPDEQKILMQILKELSDSDMGYSPTYTDIWLADYKEIPVDIDTFLNDDLYLGRTNRNGAAVYPFWRNELHTVFDAGNKFYEWILTGATRIGKTSTFNSGMAYMLYKLMCLRNPQAFFGKKDVTQFSVLFFNLTEELARGVAFREFNDTIAASPWFLQNGRMSSSKENSYYIPDGGKVSIDFGSSYAHGLGKHVYCLIAETSVLTKDGYKTLGELAKKKTAVEIAQYDPAGRVEFSKAKVQCTKLTHITVKLTLEDGSCIEGSKDHLMLTSLNKYKSLSDFAVGEALLCYQSKPVKVTATKVVLHTREPVQLYDVIDIKPHHNFIIKDKSHFISHNCCAMDEINFSQAGIRDVTKAKTRMREVYNVLSTRVKGTFKHGGEVFGKIFAASSKRSDSDFMEDYIAEQMAAGAAEHMHVSGAPQWEVLPPGTFSEKKFYIAVGDRHHKGFVVPDNQTSEEDLNALKQQGYALMTPPIDMRSDFVADFNVALRDLAGVAVPGSMSFITQELITACITKKRRNPFHQDILEIGVHDSYSIEEFFHIEDITPEIKAAGLYIHLDLALNTDRAGISGAGIIGRKDVEVTVPGQESKTMSLPVVGHGFSIAIQAPRGDKIPYDKILKFILWLRKIGLHIHVVSRDQFQSEYMGQLLDTNGFKEEKISLDRTPDGYECLRSLFAEQRVEMLDVQLLQDELIHLQQDAISRRVDHPTGSGKDVADSFAGAVWQAIKYNEGILVPKTKIASAIRNVNATNRSASKPTPRFPGLPGMGKFKIY